jgi:GntR family transcriptional regulator
MTAKWTGMRLQPRPSLAEQAAADLRLAIHDNAFGADGQLPSEPTLSRQLGVSRPTVRQAISLLEQEGLVVRRQGLGTFVLSTVAELRNNLNTNTGITDMIRAAGQHPGTSRSDVHASAADAAVARHLGVDEGTAITIVERTRTADDHPVALTRDYIATSLLVDHEVAPDALPTLIEEHKSLYRGFATRGLAVAYGIAKVLPARADAVLARELRVETDADLLLLEQTDYTTDGTPVLFSQEYLVSGPLSIYVFRRGPG